MSKSPKETAEDSLALSTFTRLSKAAGQLRRKVYSGLSDTRLTESQLNVLELLLQVGPLPQKEIAKNLLVTGGNVTMVVDNLQKRNLVERNRWQQDRRVVHVALTDEGRETIESYFPHHVKKVEKALKALDTREQEQLIALCDKLRSSLQKV